MSFADCVISGRPTRVPGEEGLRDVCIMMAAYEAAQSGTAVQLAAGRKIEAGHASA